MADSEAVQVNFGKAKQETTNLKEPDGTNKGSSEEHKVERDLDAEFVEHSSITIALIQKFSLYRRANFNVLNKKVDYIGSSINSSRILSSNKKEIETYFPALIGIASNNENFITRVKQYLNNIRIQVDEDGRTFDTSFRYNTYRDYLKVKSEIEKVEDEYNAVDKRNEVALKKALKVKCLRLNEIETSKCSFGYPINLEDYLMYRHCLLYNDVCKEISLINSDPNYRFYFKDDNKEQERIVKLRKSKNIAKAHYIEAISDNELFDNIFVQYCSIMGLPIVQTMKLDRNVKEEYLDKFSTEEPEKFNRIFSNKNLKLVSLIEMLIARGELLRIGNSQNITTSDGTFIGANMNEAVAWFNDPANASLVNAFQNKLNNM